jgi:RHS repeat-associated protein
VDLFSVGASGGAMTRLSTNLQVAGEAAWASDSTRLAFSSRGDVFTVLPDGTALTNLTNAAGAQNLFPEYAPNPRPKQLYFIHPDHLNTPRLVADAAGTTVWRWDQGEPFGVNVPDQNPSGVGAFEFPMRFPGQYFDRETNLAYNWMRDFDSAIGGYKQSDPIGLRGGLNTYAYVNGNPMSHADPFGLASEGMASYLGGLAGKLMKGLGLENQLSLPDTAGQNAAAKLCKKFQGRMPVNLFDECTTECLSQQGDTPLVSGWLNKCIDSCQETFPKCNKPPPGACLYQNNS